MKTLMKRTALAVALTLFLGTLGEAAAQATKTPYPGMAPIEQYRVASRAEEIALARSAAPPSISGDAEVLVLGAHGFESAAKGKNGFVCIVERAWANDFDHAEFWNPKVRAPTCFNPAAARSVLPTFLKRTEWVLAGASKEEMVARTKAALAAQTIKPPETGAMCFMMSKGGYLDDKSAGHWHPHVMFYLPRTEPAEWGANLPGSPTIGGVSGTEPLSVFIALVPNWSDGTPGPAMHM